MNTLTIVSKNEDFAGKWNKAEVEQDMKDLQAEGNWMDYILEHALDCHLPAEIQGIFVNNDAITRIDIVLDGEAVSIQKS